MACILELRRNADADLQEVVREGVRQLVGVLASHDRTLPYFVTREFEAYLGCRYPKQGFAWLECAPCELAGRDHIISGRGYVFLNDFDELKVLHWLQRLVEGSGASTWDELQRFVGQYFDWIE